MAGIYIAGLEMPKDGAERCIVIRGDGSVSTFVGAPIDYVRALPVPDHGRLGDLDELAQSMRNRKNYIGRLSDPDYLVADAPTVIPAERKKEEEA